MGASSAASIRYAKALFGLAVESDQVANIGAELGRLVAASDDNRELAEVLERPLFPAAERRAVLRAVGDSLSLSPTITNFCQFLIDQRRTHELRAISQEYERLAQEAAGRLNGEVIAAAPLSEDQLNTLRSALARRTGREIDLEVRVDPTLLGGVVAKVGDLVFDGSLKSRLEQLRVDLSEGN